MPVSCWTPQGDTSTIKPRTQRNQLTASELCRMSNWRAQVFASLAPSCLDSHNTPSSMMRRMAATAAACLVHLYAPLIAAGPAHDDFTDFTPELVTPIGLRRFGGPVVVLSNRRSVSTSEGFILAMKAFALRHDRRCDDGWRVGRANRSRAVQRMDLRAVGVGRVHSGPCDLRGHRTPATHRRSCDGG